MNNYIIRTQPYQGKMSLTIYESTESGSLNKIAILTYSNIEEQVKKTMLAARIIREIYDRGEGCSVRDTVKFVCDCYRKRQERIEAARKRAAEREKEREHQNKVVQEVLDRITPKCYTFMTDFKPTPIEEVIKFFIEQRKADEARLKAKESVFVVF